MNWSEYGMNIMVIIFLVEDLLGFFRETCNLLEVREVSMMC